MAIVKRNLHIFWKLASANVEARGYILVLLFFKLKRPASNLIMSYGVEV